MTEFCLLWLNVLGDLFRLVVLGLRSKSSLAAENLFLRKQLGFYQERKIKPHRTSHPAQVTLILLSRWFNWRSALTVVTPRTFIGWQRKRFQLFWRKKCQAGRPRIPLDLQRLIRTMAGENPSWGQERIANELLVKLACACRRAPSGNICPSRQARPAVIAVAINVGRPFSRITRQPLSPATSSS
jgi:hypothetical protein